MISGTTGQQIFFLTISARCKNCRGILIPPPLLLPLPSRPPRYPARTEWRSYIGYRISIMTNRVQGLYRSRIMQHRDPISTKLTAVAIPVCGITFLFVELLSSRESHENSHSPRQYH